MQLPTGCWLPNTGKKHTDIFKNANMRHIGVGSRRPFPIHPCRLAVILIAGLLILSSAVGCQETRPQSSTPSTKVTPSIDYTVAPYPYNSPTPRTTPTLQDTLPATPFPFLISNPQYSISGYHLRAWTESDSANLINKTLNFDYSHWDSTNLDKAKLAFEAERLFRFQGSPNRFDFAWETAKVDPRGIPLPTLRPGQTFFSFLVEDLLNREGIKLEKIPVALEDQGFYIHESIEIDNLFGDGRKTFVFVVETNSLQLWGAFRGVFGIHKVNGEYRVETLLDWEIFQMPSFWLGNSLQKVGDTNGNGIPEAIVEEDAYWSAMSGGATDTKYLYIFEWQSTQQVFAIYKLFIYDQRCGDPPICKDRWEWKFGPVDDSGSHPLIVTRYIIDQTDATGQPAQVISQTWSEISQQLVTPENSLNPKPDEIALAEQYVEQLLFQDQDYPAAIVHIDELLAKLPPDSSNQPDMYHPYLRYLLGIAYELNAQPQEAEAAYYQLWLDYPSDIFGVAASVKLEVN
jgi:hypothetical protein